MNFQRRVRHNRDGAIAVKDYTGAMTFLVHTRTVQELDWGQQRVDLLHLPREGEYLSLAGEGREATWHCVRLVIHRADAGEVAAELYCLRVSDIERRRLVFGQEVSGQTLPAETGHRQLLTLKEAALAAGTSTRTLRRLIQSGRLNALDYGTTSERSDWRIPREALASVKPIVPPGSVQHTPRVRRRRPASATSIPSYLPDVEEGGGVRFP